MDPTAAEASFTEVAFGINVAFAFFTEGKRLHAFFVDGKMSECIAVLKVVETSEGLDVKNDLKVVKKIQERAKRRQNGLFLVSVNLGVTCAVVCLWVLLKNDLDAMFPYEEIYLVPTIAFILGSALNTGWFWWWQRHIMRHANNMLSARAHFSLPILPEVIALPQFGPQPLPTPPSPTPEQPIAHSGEVASVSSKASQFASTIESEPGRDVLSKAGRQSSSPQTSQSRESRRRGNGGK